MQIRYSDQFTEIANILEEITRDIQVVSGDFTEISCQFSHLLQERGIHPVFMISYLLFQYIPKVSDDPKVFFEGDDDAVSLG